jgi:hypothetical protein
MTGTNKSPSYVVWASKKCLCFIKDKCECCYFTFLLFLHYKFQQKWTFLHWKWILMFLTVLLFQIITNTRTILYHTMPNCAVLYRTMLKYAVLYHTMPNCAVLYPTIPYHTVLCWSMLYCTIPCWTVLYCTVMYHTIPCWTVLHCNVPCWTVLYCTTPYHAELCCIVLFYADLCCTVPHHTMLNCALLHHFTAGEYRRFVNVCRITILACLHTFL